MMKGETITLFGDGTQARDYTYCDDIVAGVIAAVDWTATAPVGVETFNLGGNRSIPTGDMVAEIAGRAGHRAHDPVGADAAGRRTAHRRRSQQVGRRARLRAPDAVSRGNPAVRRLVPGGLWPGQTERLLTRARERFAVQDYYGAIYLLEEIVASGRAFADVHHLIGVSLVAARAVGRRRCREFARALELNPRYLEALIHQGLILSEMGRAEESEESFRRAAASVAPPSNGLPSPVAAKLANHHAELADAYAEAGALSEAIEQYERALELGPGFHDLRYRMARLMLEAGRALEAREALEEVHPRAAQLRRRGGRARTGPLPLGRRRRRAGGVEGVPRPPARERQGRSLSRDARANRE